MSWDNLSNKMGYDKLSDQPSTMGIQPNVPFKYIMGHDGTDALGFNDIYIYIMNNMIRVCPREWLNLLGKRRNVITYQWV